MKRSLPWLSRVGLVLALALSGCSFGKSPPSHFYVLNAQEDAPPQPADHALVLRITHIGLPRYLDRFEIVTPSGRNELKLADFHRWAEPLEEGIARVLAENLAQQLPSGFIAHPWPPSRAASHHLAVDVERFDATLGGEAHLAVRWWVMDDTGRKLLVEHRSEFRRAAPETDEYDALVGAMSALLADLSQEIAAELKGLRQQAG